MVFNHNWGLPGIQIPPPPFREGRGPTTIPPAWQQLRFGPLGLYDLRRRLGVFSGEPGVFETYSDRFFASDIAWFAAGASTDGAHRIGQPGFHPEFNAIWQSLPSGRVGNEAKRALGGRIQQLLFDLATIWDRALGGTTMILHSDGTTIPNTPAAPQYLQASAYLPPGFVASHSGSHASIARIAQIFIEAVGVPTVQQWRANALHRGWSLTTTGTGGLPNPPSNDLIPAPLNDSAHYRFFGRPTGALDTLLATAAQAMSPAHPPPLIFIGDDDDNVFDASTASLLDALERASYAEAQAHERQQRINELRQEVDILTAQLEFARRSAHTAPSTPVRTQATVTSPQRTPRRSPAPSTRHPPPYSPSPSTNPRSPRAAVPPRVLVDASAPIEDDLGALLRSHDLLHLESTIRLVIRAVARSKWYQELERLGLTGTVVAEIISLVA
ncbi:hypothetical protein C8R46DRAFT_1214082 [Mycena filopes]|nr:hypothetical protein C8R46DRAFT_1214082 [Mycena filopes]